MMYERKLTCLFSCALHIRFLHMHWYLSAVHHIESILFIFWDYLMIQWQWCSSMLHSIYFLKIIGHLEASFIGFYFSLFSNFVIIIFNILFSFKVLQCPSKWIFYCLLQLYCWLISRPREFMELSNIWAFALEYRYCVHNRHTTRKSLLIYLLYIRFYSVPHSWWLIFGLILLAHSTWAECFSLSGPSIGDSYQKSGLFILVFILVSC